MAHLKKRWLVEHHERTAQDFLDLLSPVTGILAGHFEAKDLIYRGHGSRTHRLIPSVFRGRRVPFPDLRPAGRRTYERQIAAEVEQIWEFFLLADARGLRLPEDSQRLRAILEECRDPSYLERVAGGEAAWPPEEVLSVLALAQHYGVPTRLLDWTRHPYVAAYFAAADALGHPHDGRMAVWAFNHEVMDKEQYSWLWDRIRMVTAPAADIPNLFAQQGLFMLLREKKFRLSAHFRAPAYDREIHRLISFDRDTEVFFKFTLPVSQAKELARLLAALGIDASTVFPGYAGVARAMRERLLLTRPGIWYNSRSARAARSAYAKVWRGWRRPG
jgi:hypothetical protein